jgi:phosphoglycerate dehydrogenase-like enzyme
MSLPRAKRSWSFLLAWLCACASPAPFADSAPAAERAAAAVEPAADAQAPAARAQEAAPRAPELATRGPEPATRGPESATSPQESLGSLRNARVAVETGGKPVPLTFFAGEIDPADLAELELVAPNVRVVAGLSRDEALARAAEADGADVRVVTPAFLAAARKLAWVQAMSAGVDRYVGMPGLGDEERIVLTNLRAVHGPAIADHVFAMLLQLTRDLRFHLANQEHGTWGREGSSRRPIALQGRTLLVVGIGGIGAEVARRGRGFGMRVIATRRSDAPAPDFVERVGKPEELLALLPEADVVVACVPLTDETTGLFDRRAFAAMKPGAYFVNIARGRVADTEALLEALRSGTLAGACLDVTDPEPLPADHPLWRLPNVVITPHVASDAELTDDRARELLRENLRRFGAGLPLLNVVDKRAGY